MKLIKLVLLSVLSVILTACSTAPGNINNQQRDVAEQGKASFYADKYHGRLTASGERFSQQAATAAHLKLIILLLPLKAQRLLVLFVYDLLRFNCGMSSK